MKWFHTLLIASMLTGSALYASQSNRVCDPYSGTQVEIPTGFEEDEDWTEEDPWWGSEYVFTDRLGRMIEIEINPIEGKEDKTFSSLLPYLPSEVEFHFRIHTREIEKQGKKGKAIEVFIDNELFVASYIFKDDNYEYAVNFIKIPMEGQFGFMSPVSATSEEDFAAIVDRVIKSLKFQN